MTESAPHTVKAILAHPYPVVASFWLAVIYAERVSVHLFIYGWAKTWWQAVTHSATIFCLLIVWTLMLAGMLVDRATIARNLGRVQKLFREVLGEILSVKRLLMLAGVVFGLSLYQSAKHNEPVWMALERWTVGAWEVVRQTFGENELVLAGSVALIYVVWLIIDYFLRKRIQAVEEAIYEVVAAAYVVTAASLFYLWLNVAIVLPANHDGAWQEAVVGLLKDTFIYSLLALAVVVGMYKATQALPAIRVRKLRWAVWAALGGTILAVALVALMTDLNYRDYLLPTSVEYPLAWQKATIRWHIMFRDFGLCLPLLAAAGLRMFREVEEVNVKERAKRLEARAKRRAAHHQTDH